MLNEKAKWIWINSEPKKNEYAFFEDSFIHSGERAVFSVCAETDYILYVNGKTVGFSQFAGYPFEKYCDEYDITELCVSGENNISLTVRYEGVDSATHIDDGAGVIFTLVLDGKDALYSSKDTRGGYDNRYIQHRERKITGQLGLSSGMRCGDVEYIGRCVEIEKNRNIKKRPVKKTEPCGFVSGVLVDREKRIYDLGREVAGYVFLKVRAEKCCEAKLAYAEHLSDGDLPYLIGGRDFSLDFEIAEGEHEFMQRFVRIAARYLSVICPDELEIVEIGVLPYLYPLSEKESGLEGLDRRIYDTCVRTLRLCMNAHYEDCPWREQALYVLDSRNQMLCGYYAFAESEFQRANLSLISKGTRFDGMLELTYPARNTPAIPFFSLMYPVAVYEYVKHTGDQTILDEVFDVISGIMDNFSTRVTERGLLCELESPFWNFYEWSHGSSGSVQKDGEVDAENEKYHLLLNCAYVYSLSHFCELLKLRGGCGKDEKERAEKIKDAIEREFYDSESGLFSLRPKNFKGERIYSQLGNAFALLIGLGDERTLGAIKNGKSLIPATLSMLTFVYDALIKRDGGHKEFILGDIREKYGYMLGCGATSFWETIEGASAFGNAGSLCHGWSAVPVYYYNILNHN